MYILYNANIEQSDCKAPEYYSFNDDKTKVIVTGKFISNPLKADTDDDGLTDEEEIYYYGTSALVKDTDGDGLNDLTEISEWFDPFEKDADNDGRLDLQEYTDGTSPFVYDKSWKDYREDFIRGFILGDFIAETGSIPMLAGQIASSCCPYVDIRDVAGNLKNHDYLFAGLSMVGLMPGAGDAVKGVGKV